MKKKSRIAGIAVLFVVLGVSLSAAYADHHRFGNGCGRGREDGADRLEEMFFGKIHAILEHRDELGIGEDKIAAIRGLKLETKKALIKENADIQVVSLDIATKLQDNPVDVDGVNRLQDQKYELEKVKAKNIVVAIAKLKGTLTKEQFDKLHKLWHTGAKDACVGRPKACPK